MPWNACHNSYHNALGTLNVSLFSVGLCCCIFKGHTPVRLEGGNLPSEGRVEIQYHGAWGTVCNQGFTASDGDVICRMMGFNDSCVYYFNQLKEISLFTKAKRLTKCDREHRK